MSLKVYLQHGGDADSTVEDITAKTRAFKGTDGVLTAAGAYGEGTGAQGDFIVIDDDGSFTAYAHNRVTITEDASGDELWLHRGPISRSDWGRGPSAVTEAARDIHVVVNDGNSELNGLDLIEDWVRPEETGTERLLALGAAFLNGSPRLSTNITVARKVGDGHLVVPNPDDGEATMPATTYEVGTHVVDIIRECAETEGQNWGVTIHDVAGVSHLCLLYMEEDDFAAYPSTLSISDVLSEVDSATVFEPWWRQGPAMEKSGGEPGAAVLSGIITEYGDAQQHVIVHDPAQITKYDYFVEKVMDATTTSQTAAEGRAPHLLNGRKREDVTHQPSLLLPAAKAHLIRPGMSISIKSAAARHEETYGSAVTRIVAQVKLTPYSPKLTGGERFYIADLYLARPKKIARQRRQPGPPRAPRPAGTASCSLPGSSMERISTPNSGFETGLDTNWVFADIGASGPVGPATGDWEGDYYGITSGAGHVRYTGLTGYTFLAGTTYVFRLRVNDANVTSFFAISDTGLITVHEEVSAGAASGVWVDLCLEWTPGSNLTNIVPMVYSNSGLDNFKLDDLRVYMGSAGESTEPVGETGSGSSGDTTQPYAPLSHIHEHGDLTGANQYHDADQVSIDDVGGYFTGTSVEAALQEVGASSGITDYLRDRGGAEHLVQAHGTVGATETIDPEQGNWHALTLDANLTLTLTNPAASVGAELLLELTQDGSGAHTLTLPASVSNKAELEAAYDTTASTTSFLVLWTRNTGTTWYGAFVGGSGGGGASALDDLSDVTITSVAANQTLINNGSGQFVNSSAIWRPLMDGAGNVITDGGTGEAIMALS